MNKRIEILKQSEPTEINAMILEEKEINKINRIKINK